MLPQIRFLRDEADTKQQSINTVYTTKWSVSRTAQRFSYLKCSLSASSENINHGSVLRRRINLNRTKSHRQPELIFLTSSKCRKRYGTIIQCIGILQFEEK